MILRRRMMGGSGDVPFNRQYLTFEALESGSFTLTIGASITPTNLTNISYSLDNGKTWNTTNNVSGTEVVVTTPVVAAGDKVLWKGTALAYSASSGYSTFSSTGLFNVYGSLISLYESDNFKGKPTITRSSAYFAYRLFCNSKVVNAENLFLPTNIHSSAYYSAFQGCVNLITAPELPATTLASYCYQYMFNGCSSLTTAPNLPATTLASSCYKRMFYGCTSLTTAPELNATTLANFCYQYMFNGCTSLNYIKCLATDISASSCTTNWVNGVSATGTFVKDANMNDWTTGASGIPSGWTVINAQ